MKIDGYTPISSLCHSDEELMHYGIKGMKWGVRRYQKKDGSLTTAGKNRRTNGESEAMAKARKEYDEISSRAKAYARKSGAGKSISELKKMARDETDKDEQYRIKRERDPDNWDAYSKKSHEHDIRSREYTRMAVEKRRVIEDKLVKANQHLHNEQYYDESRQWAQRNIDRFSKSSSPVSKLLVKTNTLALNQNTRKRNEYKEKVDDFLKELSADDVMVRATPYGHVFVIKED